MRRLSPFALTVAVCGLIAGSVAHAQPHVAQTTGVQCGWVGAPVYHTVWIHGIPIILPLLSYANDPEPAVYGLDLGRPVFFNSSTYLLFGDTWPFVSPDVADDTAALLSDTSSCPAVSFLNTNPIRLWTRQIKRTELPTGPSITPVAAFGDAAAVHVIYSPSTYQSCTDSSQCDPGDTCVADADPRFFAGVKACYGTTNSGVPNFFRLGPTHFASATPPGITTLSLDNVWGSREFVSVSARTVPDFNKTNPGSSTYWYDPAFSFATQQGSDPVAFVWGKPAHWSLHDPVPTYLMYFPLPFWSLAGSTPEYFTGISGGIPTWSTVSADAVPVIPGTAEMYVDGAGNSHPILWPDQVSVSFVTGINSWVMLYGSRPLGYPGMPDAASVANDQTVGVFMRSAPHPWGPWSAPVLVYSAARDGGYQPGGWMFHPVTNQSAYDYVNDDPTQPRNADWLYGREYGASIIDSLTRNSSTRFSPNQADIYWAMSTGTPYRVLMMHTHLQITN